MLSEDALMRLAQKLKALRQIQFTLRQTDCPLARACGLTQEELAVLANEEMIEVRFSSDDGPDLDRYHITEILPKGFSILAQDFVAEPDPLRVAVVPPHRTVYQGIFEKTRSGLWDLIKIALGAVLGWFEKIFSIMPNYAIHRVNNPGASSGALRYEKTEIERSKLRGIQPGRQNLMKSALRSGCKSARKLRPRQTCLYSEASMWPRILSAAAQS